ncbi:hypothetical protein NDU88_004052 [Pleurodeles waltl]|uniref:Uncharacterized protein n=1 Tax=Pleurodeles waltl TaxID=8319 RepID=A0AAV7WWK6_PLEWA|nr:hypothetical protein NDU88_004052 [Pleurodeles waltl]
MAARLWSRMCDLGLTNRGASSIEETEFLSICHLKSLTGLPTKYLPDRGSQILVWEEKSICPGPDDAEDLRLVPRVDDHLTRKKPVSLKSKDQEAARTSLERLDKLVFSGSES